MKLQIVSTDTTDHTITVMVDGVRYEYWLSGNYTSVEDTVRLLIRKGTDGKALNLLKAWSKRVDKIGG